MTQLEILGVLIMVFGSIFAVIVLLFLVMCMVGMWKSMRDAFK